MKPEQIIPFLAPLIRNALVAVGGFSAAKADHESSQLAGAAAAIIGFGWSLWNARHKSKIHAELKEAKAQLADTEEFRKTEV